MALVAVTVAIGLVNFGLVVLRSQKWYRRRLCHRNLLNGLGHRKRRKRDHGVGLKCGSRGAIRASRVVLYFWCLSHRMMMGDIYE